LDAHSMVEKCLEPVDQHIEENGVHVARLGIVITRAVQLDSPAQVLIDRFCNERVKDPDSPEAPLRNPLNFEIHNHKRYEISLPSQGLTVNSWVRCKTGTDGPEDSPAVIVEQDLNTFPATGCGSGSGTVLEGYDDWSNLRYNFRASSNFAPAAHLEIVNEALTDEDYFKLENFWKQFLHNKYTYSAKFVCVAEVGSEGDAVSPGRYRTAINVHNPHSTDVVFLKKAVIARNENEERGQISELVEDQLAADEALSINCKSIAARFGSEPTIGDGFVVLKSNEPLDVVAVYTSRDSVDVEYIKPTVLEPEEETPEPEEETPEPEEERPDLTVRLPEQTRVSCSSSQGSCTHTVIVEIENLSRVDVNTPFQVEVQTDNGLSTTLDVPSLAGGETQILPAILGPGDNCYNPECEVQAIVDSANVVMESDETNNTAERLDQG